MAVWLELRCERRGRNGSDCWSNQNNGPMLMAGADTQTGVAQAARDLFGDAAAQNWRRMKDGWVCPCCSASASPPSLQDRGTQ